MGFNLKDVSFILAILIEILLPVLLAVFIFALGSVLFTVLIGIREKKKTVKEETAT